MNLPIVLTIAAMVPSVIGGTWVGYNSYDEIKTQVAENTTARLLNTWQRLSAAKKERRLSREEFIAWCDAGIRLRIITTCKEN